MNEAVAGAVAELRKATRMSATALAEQLKVQAKTIRSYESGVTPGPQRLFALAVIADTIGRENLYTVFVEELQRMFSAGGYGIEVTRPHSEVSTNG